MPLTRASVTKPIHLVNIDATDTEHEVMTSRGKVNLINRGQRIKWGKGGAIDYDDPQMITHADFITIAIDHQVKQTKKR